MIGVKFDARLFKKEMDNIIEYSIGFLDGAKAGKAKFMKSLGEETAELLGNFIDTNARVSPATLQHVYEWYQTGSPEARLFDIHFVANPNGIKFSSSFRQSTTVKSGSNVPFYNKASIIENGQSVTIRPRMSNVLAFEVDGETVFTRKPVVVDNPGGTQAQNKFEATCNIFFTQYFAQSFLKTSRATAHLSNPIEFKNNIRSGKRAGRSAGVTAGYNWITKVGVA